MKAKGIKILAIPVLLAALIYFFVISPEVLGKELLSGSGLPAGTLISWAGLFIYAFLMFGLMKGRPESSVSRSLKTILLLNVILAGIWGILSYLLAGNWSFNFTNSNFSFRFWIGITLFIVLIPLISFIIFAISRVLSRLTKH
ncbi:hypothetical protein [Maribellus sediminis]|uniref:hypothetical protein n=1 Tax=Maribellus sediminis TaxID=2696285 RepID=UPI001431A211|nr:hypothetical protein [Maribellus sediminis]